MKESELTPSNANILDGRYAVFGYVTENQDFLADLKVGDVIQLIQVVSGIAYCHLEIRLRASCYSVHSVIFQFDRIVVFQLRIFAFF